MRAVTLTAVAALALAVAGCQAAEDKPASATSRAAVQAFADACARDDPNAAQLALTAAARRAFIEAGSARDGCRAILGVPAAGARVAAVRERGGRAEVLLTGAGGVRSAAEAEDVGDTWLVTSARLSP